jgi:hypothetical protein
VLASLAGLLTFHDKICPVLEPNFDCSVGQEISFLARKGNPMEIKFEDLVVRCKHCNGTGRINTSTGASQGLPDVGVTGYSGDCIDCGGLGGELTESGKAVRQLIEWMRSRHLI